jgi:hypothetical protein
VRKSRKPFGFSGLLWPRCVSALGVLVASLALPSAVAANATATPTTTAAAGPTAVAARGICNSAKVPCHFSTPSGNIRCLWTPKPNNVACVMLANGRAYRLHPTGKATAIQLKRATRGQTLALNEQLVFPGSYSCRDTRSTMICNQDFLAGAFTLAPGHSHSS